MVYSVRFSDYEQELIGEYAKLMNLEVSEVIRRATMEKIENEIDIAAFIEAKKEFEKNPVTYSHEEVGKELGFL